MKIKQKIKFRVYYFSTKIYESDLSDESLTNVKTTFEQYIWHVKQNNNGITFLGYIDNIVD